MDITEKIIGTWILQSIFYKDSKGEKVNLYGENPNGILMYDKFGFMNAQIGNSNRTLLKESDVESQETKVKSYDTYIGYYGTFFKKDKNTIIHKVIGCQKPDWEGEEEVRIVSTQGNVLYITTPPTTINGHETKIEVYWERAKQ